MQLSEKLILQKKRFIEMRLSHDSFWKTGHSQGKEVMHTHTEQFRNNNKKFITLIANIII